MTGVHYIEDSIRVECPKCGARPLEPCEGYETGVSFHAERHDVYYERFIAPQEQR